MRMRNSELFLLQHVHMADRLFIWGANSYGQLGAGNKTDTPSPVECVLSLPECVRLKQVSGGGGHTILLTVAGTVVAFGWNKDGQLGLGPSDDVTLPRQLQLTASIVKVACGWNHTLAITRSGALLAWGSNAYGQLGMQQERRNSPYPIELAQELFGGSSIRDIAAGLRHSLAVTEEGVVYSWGDGRKGQLGGERSRQGGMASQPESVSFPFPAKCTSCAAGSYHCVALSEQGGVFTWGLNQDGQCGLPPGETSPGSTPRGCGVVCSPHHLEGLPPVDRVSCGWSHTITICADGRVMVWGRSDYGQLGLEPHLLATVGRCSYKPAELVPLRGAHQVVCGSEHTIAINGSGDVFTWGWNEHGMCGTGHEENVLTPYMLPVPVEKQMEAVLVGSGAGHTMLVVRDNQRSRR